MKQAYVENARAFPAHTDSNVIFFAGTPKRPYLLGFTYFRGGFRNGRIKMTGERGGFWVGGRGRS
jgi:hypothetical protein